MPPLKDDVVEAPLESVELPDGTSEPLMSSKNQQHPSVSFSHVQAYASHLEDFEVYKAYEEYLNSLSKEKVYHSNGGSSLPRSQRKDSSPEFEPYNRDIVKQLLAGFGFRVTGHRYRSEDDATPNTRSVLLTTPDRNGVQIVVTAPEPHPRRDVADKHQHFDSENLTRYWENHKSRSGFAVLGFQTDNADLVRDRYIMFHPRLIHNWSVYNNGLVKVLEVYAYYSGKDESQADSGTLLRFIQDSGSKGPSICILPGLNACDAEFDRRSLPAYFDHWVSNVESRTGFLKTLEDTLGFSPKVNFNAGVVAAGEAQIESTVTGNETNTIPAEKALVDQSQVYLPINNALTEVGHVHAFLRDLGQGIQHIASRVDDLVGFVQQANDNRKLTGEGFTFLRVPRSYYGVLTMEDLESSCHISRGLARYIFLQSQAVGLVASDGAVSLELPVSPSASSEAELVQKWEENMPLPLDNEWTSLKRNGRLQSLLDVISRSRYKNLYMLLGKHLDREAYLQVVRNQILVDVQGQDLLYQIFTCKVLQDCVDQEAPFLEFIQRVCSECLEDWNGDSPADTTCHSRSTRLPSLKKVRPGCGGFGIRNFLTLFLSIEVSKAMAEATNAEKSGNQVALQYARARIACFTDQLNESNPILTSISDAMTMEGMCKGKIDAILSSGNPDGARLQYWQAQLDEANTKKDEGNWELMACSSKYQERMRKIREEFTCSTMS